MSENVVIRCDDLEQLQKSLGALERSGDRLMKENSSLESQLALVTADRDRLDELLDRLDEAAHRANPQPAGTVCWEAIADLPGEFAKVKAERDSARRAIESFGSNPAGFDWAVLAKVEELESQLAAMTAERDEAKQLLSRLLLDWREVTK